VKERVERSAEETERLQTWLKSAEAKEFVRQSPELKESFFQCCNRGENSGQRAS